MANRTVTHSPFLIAALLMIAAFLCISVMDATAKSLIQSGQPTLQVVWARYTSQTVIVFVMLSPRLPGLLVTRYPMIQLLRSAMLFGATLCFFLSLRFMGIASATAVFEVAPLFVTVLAFLVLRETVGLRRWLGVFAGLVGALIIIRPGTEVFSLYTLLPAAAAFCYASFAVTTRFLGREESPWTSLLYTAVFGTIAASILAPFNWVTPGTEALFKLLSLGVLASAGHYCLIRAFTLADASFLAPFGYASLLFNTLWGVIFFAEFPDLLVYIGSAIIVGAGLYVWKKELQAGKDKAATPR